MFFVVLYDVPPGCIVQCLRDLAGESVGNVDGVNREKIFLNCCTYGSKTGSK